MAARQGVGDWDDRQCSALAASPAGGFANLMIGFDRVTAVLLADGWHKAATDPGATAAGMETPGSG
jgi:hypothetical protein